MPDFGRLISEFIYSLIVMLAGVHWSLQKAVIMAGYTIKLINQWLIENAFAPIIAQTNDSLRVAVSYVFIIALLALGLTYMLAALVRLDVVSPRSALAYPQDVMGYPQPVFSPGCGIYLQNPNPAPRFRWAAIGG